MISNINFFMVTTELLEYKKEKTAKIKKSAGWDLLFIFVGLLSVLSWYLYRPQIIAYWDKGVESSQELSVNSFNSTEKFLADSYDFSRELSANSWNAYANIFKRASFPAIKLPAFSLASFNFKLPSFHFKWPVWNFKFPSFRFPSFKLPTFSFPSFHFKFPSLTFSWPVWNFNKIFGITNSQNTSAENTEVVNCGTTAAPDLKNSKTYEKNQVLSCLGKNALSCHKATGVLTDPLFPTIFEISNNQGVCNFKLSYPNDSPLVNITGNKLAGQYLSCPVKIAQAVDDTNPNAVKFVAPNKKDLSKYASQIYFYGTLGLFVQNNLDKNQITASGCSGSYIDSVIASYQKMQSQK